MLSSAKLTVSAAVVAIILSVGMVSPSVFDRSPEARLAALRGIPGVVVNEYSVHGSTPEEVRAELDTWGPKDEHGNPRDAFTRWKVAWRFPRENGQPDFRSTSVSLNVEITVPRWEGVRVADVEAQQRWNSYLSAVVEHERHHLRLVRDRYTEIETAIRQAYSKNPELTESQAARIAGETIAKIRALDRRYDEHTRHGFTEGVVFP